MEKRSRMLVYAMDVEPLDDEGLFAKLYGGVSSDRRKKIDRLHFKKDRRLSLGVEYLLQRACRTMGIEYGEDLVYVDDKRKPQLKDGRYHMSLSHSGSMAMCVMADREVGCDVQECVMANMEIAKRFFSPEEYLSLQQCPEEDRNDMFYRLWTLKESYIKCIGKGLRALDSISFNLEKDEAASTASSFRFHEHHEGRYRYAWCINSDEPIYDEVQIEFIEIEKPQ